MTDIRDRLRENLDTLCNDYTAEHRISDSELARRLEYSPQKLFKLRNLQLDIRFDDAERITQFFDVTIAWLCGESELKKPLTQEMQVALRQLLDRAN